MKVTYLKHKIFSFLFFLCGSFCFSENLKFGLDFSLTFPGNAKISFVNTSSFFDIYGGFKTNDFPIAEKTLYAEPSHFCVRFSPIVFRKPKNSFEPVLSVFFGNIKQSRNFKKLYTLSFGSVTESTSGLSFPKIGNFGLLKSSMDTDVGLEIAVKGFGFNFLMTPSEKVSALNYGLLFSWQNEQYGIFTSAFTGFSPSEKRLLLNSERINYNSVYGFSFMYKNPFFGFETAGSISKNQEGKLGFNLSAQIDSTYKIIALNTGFSYASFNYLGWQNKYRATDLCFFVNPQIKYGFFAMMMSYNYFIKPPKKTEDYVKGEKKSVHSFGNKLQLKNDYVKWSTTLRYKEKEFLLYNVCEFFAPSSEWFKSIKLNANMMLEPKQSNPYIIQKYSFGFQTDFILPKNFTLAFSSVLTQENKRKEKLIDGKSNKVIEWQNISIEGSASLDFTLKTQKAENKFGLKIEVYNIKPFYKIALTYKLKTAQN